MPCKTYDELDRAIANAMIAEHRARGIPGDRRQSMSQEEYLQRCRAARSSVASADFFLNRHISECELCTADGRATVNHTHG